MSEKFAKSDWTYRKGQLEHDLDPFVSGGHWVRWERRPDDVVRPLPGDTEQWIGQERVERRWSEEGRDFCEWQDVEAIFEGRRARGAKHGT